MKTSITTIVWGKMHTLAELREVLAEVRRIEYDGVGLETRLLPREAIQNPRLVRKTLEESGVENAGSYSTMKLQDVAWASEAGTPLLWVVARGDREYDEAVGAVAQLSSLAAKSGIALALHNHLGTRFETEAPRKKPSGCSTTFTVLPSETTLAALRPEATGSPDALRSSIRSCVSATRS